jgi:ATP-dependent DNA helicase 2 subunit 1
LKDRQADIDKTKIVYGADLGASASADGDEDNEESNGTFGARVVKAGSRVSHCPHGIFGV